MNVLILGGTGLISTGITRLLLETFGVDISVWHYNRGRHHGDFGDSVKRIIGDRYDPAAFEAQMADGSLPRFDAVVDMIGYSLPDAESLLRAFDGRCGQILFCSTVDVYARPASRYPVVESEPFRPTAWEYAQKKAEMERFFATRQPTMRQPFTVLRPAHTYGETGALLHAFDGGSYYLDRLRRGKPIIVPGDGESLWASAHRDDVALAFVTAIGNSQSFGKSYSLPGHECMTWNQIHQTVARAIGAPEPELVPIPTDLLFAVDSRAHITAINFRYNNVFDMSAARADLGFDPKITLADGAARIYQNLLEANAIQNSDDVPQDDRVLAAWSRLRVQMKEELQQDES